MKVYPTNNYNYVQLLSIVVLFVSPNSYAINLESAKERTCFPVTKTANVDHKWMTSVKEWYYPLMSRLDLYLTSLEIYGKPEDPTSLSESQLYYKSCVKAGSMNDIPFLTGFNGKRTTQTWDPSTVTDDGVTSTKFTAESGYTGMVYTTLTDNSTYLFSVVCLDDDQATWGVVSTVATLPKETVKLIHDHAESLSFKRAYFEELRYAYCKDEHETTASVEEGETCN